MSNLKLLIILLGLFAFVPPIFVLKAHASSQNVAASAISQAEEVSASAYETVLEAERAGATVSNLLARLNNAGELLAKARIAYRSGDFDDATRSANLCYEIGEEVKSEAHELRSQAHEPQITAFLLTMTGSLVGVVAVVFGSFVGWCIFKRRYYERLLKMKPEVASDEP